MIEKTVTGTGRGQACGKVILLGEHAVVHGFPALAVGLHQGIQAIASPCAGPFSLCAKAWNLRVSLTEDTPHGRALLSLIRTLDFSPENVMLEVMPHIPPRAGLGASAAMAAAAARSLASRLGRTLSNDLLFNAVQASEKIFHGAPSGLDAAMAIFGGVSLFTKADKTSPIKASVPKLLVVHSGEPKDTARSVARFASRIKESPAEADRRLRCIGEIVQLGADALKNGDDESLGALMTENHRHLAWFDVSSPKLDRIVEIALKNGALGAKLTGGGRGGCAVLLLPRDSGKTESAIQTAGFEKVVMT